LGKNKTAVHYLVRVTTNVQLPEDKIEAFKKLGTKTYDEMFVDMQKYLDQQRKSAAFHTFLVAFGSGILFKLLFDNYLFPTSDSKNSSLSEK